ncbi:MAG: hypothetical protein U0746_22060 [Gemmataceae bacterium]
MNELTPLQCFIGGMVISLLIGAVVWWLVWRKVSELRKRSPELFAKDGAARRARLNALTGGQALDTRQRELELLERIAKNQEVMIELLRQSLGERVMS